MTAAIAAVDRSRWRHLEPRGLAVDFPIFLAPMVGLSHVALRKTVRRFFPEGARSLVFTEMLSSRRLPAERIGDRPETIRAPDEFDLVPQLLANEERFLVPSIRKLAALQPVALDVNMGCPVSKALKHNWGVALMGDPRLAERVVRDAVRLSPWPVSVKLRTGIEDDPAYLVDFVQMLENAGAAWLTIHPRFAAQQRRGRARWDYLARARDSVRIPVVGNGDVQVAEDGLAMLSRTGCDGIMIGRAAVARPWIFWQLGVALGNRPPMGLEAVQPPAEPLAEGDFYARVLDDFIQHSAENFSLADALRRIRFFVHWGARWLDFGHELWRRIRGASDIASVQEVRREFFAIPQRMAARTTLAQ